MKYGHLLLLAVLPSTALALSITDLMIRTKPPVVKTMETTGYCNCGSCCSWEYSWFGLGPPVYVSGPLKGKRKQVGRTAGGTKTHVGTIAADTSKLPIGTLLYVPGYGWGRVEDRGGAIKGDKLDLWFEDHEKALQWGRRKTPVKIWLLSKPKH